MRGLTLFFDCETNGFPLWAEPSNDPRQPHIVELAAVLATQDRKVVASLAMLVKPDGWTITEDMTAIHGISHQMAAEGGLPEFDVLVTFWHMWAASAERVAFNEPFDARIIRIGLKRMGWPDPANEWSAAKGVCAKRMATPIVKMPPSAKMIAAGRGASFKDPKLDEAYRHFTGEPMKGAHRALADTKALMTVFYGCLDAGAARPVSETKAPAPAREAAPPPAPPTAAAMPVIAQPDDGGFLSARI